MRNTAVLPGVATILAIKSAVTRRVLLASVVLASGIFAVGATPAHAQAARVPDIHYEPTPHNVVADMLRLGGVRDGDLVYDLGCGDGRSVIAAARAGARGVCVDIDPQRIIESRANAAAAGVSERIRFLEQDLFTTDFRDATMVFLFLWPDLNLKLRAKLWRELKPGSRVVSYVHDMGDWPPRQTLKVQGAHGERNLYLWVIEAPAAK